MKFNRTFLIVLDSFGIGEMPDAKDFGDEGSNTLKAVFNSKEFNAPNLQKLGLFNIDGVEVGEKVKHPTASFARLQEKSKGKDTTTGHWELCTVISHKPMPTYPDGFPKEIIDEFSKKTGRGVLCNKPYSGTQVIADYGEKHLKTGDLIVYTSADSVFQIAAHEDIVPTDTLYEYCRIARKILAGEHAVGRVIARPFTGESGSFKRTENRHDFSLLPPSETTLDRLENAGFDVISVGKIYDIFAGKGITEKHITKNNSQGMAKTKELLNKDFCGLCFTNLVDFDMVYGHRNDTDGYAKAISEFDRFLGEFIEEMGENDLLIVTADHGCDPSTESTDHSREYVPFIAYAHNELPQNFGTVEGFDFVGRMIENNFIGD
ncbi:MAG: phosphopentomutase [Clostridia bacterium]|nr:phosphopentomutase [Clostridia bacterium]